MSKYIIHDWESMSQSANLPMSKSETVAEYLKKQGWFDLFAEFNSTSEEYFDFLNTPIITEDFRASINKAAIELQGLSAEKKIWLAIKAITNTLLKRDD